MIIPNIFYNGCGKLKKVESFFVGHKTFKTVKKKCQSDIILCEDQLLTTMQWRMKKAENDRRYRPVSILHKKSIRKLIEDSTDPFAGMCLIVGDKRRTNLGERWESDFEVALGRGNFKRDP